MPVRRASLAVIFVTLLIDMLGFGLIAPTLPTLVDSLVGGAVADASILYGLLLSLYALMQLLCAPALGVLSDRFGRRPVILLALFGLGCDYVLLYFAPNLWWVALGRVIGGAVGASYSPASAYIADISPPEQRARNFGLIGVAFGLGFIVGPALGGLLGASDVRLPFLVAAGLAFVNFLFGLFVLPESLRHERRRPIVLAQAKPVGALQAVWRYRAVSALLPVYLVASLAQQGLQAVWVPYTTYRYQWGSAEVGWSLAVVGLLFAVAQGVLVGPVVARFGEMRSLVGGLVIGLVGFVGFGLATEGWLMYVVTAVYFAGFGVLHPAARSLISGGVPDNEQGLLQGALTSGVTLTAVVGPPLATGVFASFIGPHAPLVVPGAPFFVGSVLFGVGLLLAVRQARLQRVREPVPELAAS
jgi:DHA1 family tetracycline resistance protein-like MFS transporter